MTINILISDPDPLAREGIKEILGGDNQFRIACEAQNAFETFQALYQFQPDVCILEIAMEKHAQLGFVRQTKHRAEGAPILVISRLHERDFALRTIRAGAAGYLSKDCTAQQLMDAVHTTAAHKPYISETVCELLADSITARMAERRHETLSDDDFEIFTLMANSLPTTKIATLCNMRVGTVRNRKTQIMKKMDLRNQTEVIEYALEHGLLDRFNSDL